MMKFLTVVRILVNKIEILVVVHLLDAEIKRNLNGFLCSLGSQYIVGTLVQVAAALRAVVEMICSCAI